MTLSPLQELMLRQDVFQLDGWCTPLGIQAAETLFARGLLSCVEHCNHEAQYTYREYRITEAGRALRN